MFSEIIPMSKLDLFLRTVRVASYIPGRARLYHKDLVGNWALAQKVRSVLLGYEELDSAGGGAVTINTNTGSVLIEYDPAVLRKNEELRRAEAYIMNNNKGERK